MQRLSLKAPHHPYKEMIITVMRPTRNMKEWTHSAQHAAALIVSLAVGVEGDDYYSNGPHKN